jgi:hypothetical protein
MGDTEVNVYAFLALALDGSEKSSFMLQPLYFL